MKKKADAPISIHYHHGRGLKEKSMLDLRSKLISNRSESVLNSERSHTTIERAACTFYTHTLREIHRAVIFRNLNKTQKKKKEKKFERK